MCDRSSNETSFFRCLLGTFIIFSLYLLVLVFPRGASVGLYLRFDSIVWPLCAAFVFLKLNHRVARVHILLLSVLLCGTILKGIWYSGFSNHNLIAGLLPFSDAGGYIEGCLSLLHHGTLTNWASRRPLTAVVQSILMLLSNGNLRFMLALLVLFSAVSIALATHEFYRLYGRIAACALFIGLIAFYRRYIGTTLSEHLGIIYGCLAVAFLFRTLRTFRWGHGVACVCFLSIGLFARAGAFFTLFLLPISLLFIKKRGPRINAKFSGSVMLAILIPFCVNKMIGASLGNPSASMGNFSYTLYGLVSGGNWTQVLSDYPEISSLDETDQYEQIYNLAFDRIREKPATLIFGFLRAYRDYFFSTQGAFGFFLFVPGEWLILERGTEAGLGNSSRIIQDFISKPWPFIQAFAAAVTFVCYSILSVIGMCVLLKEKNYDSKCFLLIAIGMLASVPFVPPWDADWMRAYAATIPIALVFPALGFKKVTRYLLRAISHLKPRKLRKITRINIFSNGGRHARDEKYDGPDLAFNGFASLMLILPISGLLIFNIASPPFLSNDQIITGRKYQLHLIPGSTIHFEEEVVSTPLIIGLTPAKMKRNMVVFRRSYPDEGRVLNELLSPGNKLMLAYDITASRLKYVLLQEGLLNDFRCIGNEFLVEPVTLDPTGHWLKISACE